MSLSVNGVSGHVYTDIEKKFQYQQLGIPDDVISQGTSAIEDYAYENGITLPNFETQDEEPLFETSENETTQSAAAQNSNVAEANDPNKKLRYNA
mgnify:CR=1 FL=1